jgi:hypothetical protein
MLLPEGHLTQMGYVSSGAVDGAARQQARKDRGKRLLRGLSGRVVHAEFLEPRLDGTTRLPDCFRDVIVCHVLKLRQDLVTRIEQFPQNFGLFHDANLAAVRLLKTASFRQTLLSQRTKNRRAQCRRSVPCNSTNAV